MIDNPDLKKDRFFITDWDLLTKIYRFLKPFQDATLAIEGYFYTIERNLPTFDFLLRHYENIRVIY